MMRLKYLYRGAVALTVFNVSLQAVANSVDAFVIGATWHGSFYAFFAFVLIVQALFICVEGVE